MRMLDYRSTRDIPLSDVLLIYRANGWPAAEKPELLHKALLNSETLISAWDGEKLVGLGNAISDGYLVVYYPHLLVLPAYHGRGIGREIMRRLRQSSAHAGSRGDSGQVLRANRFRSRWKDSANVDICRW
jgi:GNAT superfamily N-acetyltransferase